VDGDPAQGAADRERKGERREQFVTRAFVEIGEFTAQGLAGPAQELGVVGERRAGLALFFAPDGGGEQEREEDKAVADEENPGAGHARTLLSACRLGNV